MSKSETLTAMQPVNLPPAAKTALQTLLKQLREQRVKKAAIEAALDQTKLDIEALCEKHKIYDTLVEGIGVQTSFGAVSLKLVTGKTAARFNPALACKTLYLKIKGKYELVTPQDLQAKCYDPPKDKKPYLGVFLPGEDNA